MHSSPSTPWRAYAALALSTSLAGSYVGLSKLLLLVFPVFLLAWLRFAIAGLLMSSWLKRGAAEPALDGRTRWLLFLEPFIGNFLFSICLLFGLQRSSAIVPAGEANLLCAALLLAAMFCEASYVVIGKRLTVQISARRISALINLWGLVLITLLGLWQASSYEFASPSPANWALLVFYAAAASMVSVWLWMAGLRQVPAAKAGVFMVFLPLATGLVGLALGAWRATQPAAGQRLWFGFDGSAFGDLATQAQSQARLS